MKEKKINVSEFIGSTKAVVTNDGEILYARIINELAVDDAIIRLDFLGIDAVTATFLNVSIGQIYGRNPKLLERIKIENLAREDLQLLKKIIDNAREYFKNKGEA